MRLTLGLEARRDEVVDVVVVCRAAPERRDARRDEILRFDRLRAGAHHHHTRRPGRLPLLPRVELAEEVGELRLRRWSRQQPTATMMTNASAAAAAAAADGGGAAARHPAGCRRDRDELDIED